MLHITYILIGEFYNPTLLRRSWVAGTAGRWPSVIQSLASGLQSPGPGSSWCMDSRDRRLVAGTRSGVALKTVALLLPKGLRHNPAPSQKPAPLTQLHFFHLEDSPASSCMAADSILSTVRTLGSPPGLCLPGSGAPALGGHVAFCASVPWPGRCRRLGGTRPRYSFVAMALQCIFSLGHQFIYFMLGAALDEGIDTDAFKQGKLYLVKSFGLVGLVFTSRQILSQNSCRTHLERSWVDSVRRG